MKMLCLFLVGALTQQTDAGVAWWVGTCAALIRQSDLSDERKGQLLRGLVKNGMDDSQVRVILGKECRPMIFGTGYRCQDWWYPDYGLTVFFDKAIVVGTHLSLPPRDMNGVPMKLQ